MEYITLGDLASELGVDRSNFFKYVKKQGFETVYIRTPKSRNQPILALTQDDADELKRLRSTQGYNRHSMPFATPDKGSFYIIQLVPEYCPLRIKLGVASDVNTRLTAHRTAAPTATLVKCWPILFTWEATAIASITRIGCKRIGDEVFDCDDIETLVARADTFFSIMPVQNITK